MTTLQAASRRPNVYETVANQGRPLRPKKQVYQTQTPATSWQRIILNRRQNTFLA